MNSRVQPKNLEVMRQPLEDRVVTFREPFAARPSSRLIADRRFEPLPMWLSHRSSSNLQLHATRYRALHGAYQRSLARSHRYPYRSSRRQFQRASRIRRPGTSSAELREKVMQARLIQANVSAAKRLAPIRN